MQIIKEAIKELGGMCQYAKQVIFVGFWCAMILFVIALLSGVMAFRADYHQQILIHRTALEAAPTTFTTGLIAAFLCDLMDRSIRKYTR